MGVVALYLLYLSYQLFEARGDNNTTMTPAVRIMFIALFVIASVALLIYAVRLWRHSKEDDDQPQQNDKNSLK